MTKSTPILKFLRKKPPVVIPIGVGLDDLREECFCLLVADGVPLAIAWKTAGYTAKHKSGALHLYGAPRIQDRVTAILRARASHPAVTLSEVTDMLKRVYTGAIHSGEFTPAHNAAFSLARLYGLVVDRAQLDVIRKPSREPDAPAEVALSSWIADLPSYNPSPQGSSPTGQGPGLLIEGSAYGCDLDTTRARLQEGPGAIGNGAPMRPVTGTPHAGGRTAPLSETGSPLSDEGTILPSAEDLF